MSHYNYTTEAVNWTLEDDEPADELEEGDEPNDAPPLLNNWGRAQTGGRLC
jgi:hypothetical protein